MAIEYYSSIDLNKNELQNAVVQNAGTAPGSPGDGQIYFDSTAGDKALYYYNGSAWIRVGGQITHHTTDTISSGDFMAFSDESEDAGDEGLNINNKLTVDNFIKTAPALLTEASVANGDYIMFLDGGATGDAKKEAVHDLATLFAGSGLTATNSVIAVDTLNQDTSGTADKATHVLITDNESTDEENQITFVEGAAGGGAQRGLEADGDFTYNPSTGTVSATILKAGTLDIDSGGADINGTLEANTITIGGNNILTGGIVTTLGTIAQDTIVFQSSNADDPLLTIENNANDATGARLLLLKDKGAAGADGDEVGEVIFAGDDDAQAQTNFVKLRGLISDASNGAEGGKFEVRVATHDGEMQPGLTITDGSEEDELDVILGNGANSTVTIPGNLIVTGETTTVNVTTTTTSNGVVFEGTTGDGHDGTLKSVVAGADVTYTLPNVTGHVALFAADPSTTAISSTPTELNLLDAGTAGGSVTLATGDSIIIGDASASNASKKALMSDVITLIGTNITETGALNSGSITSGFGAIDNGSSGIKSNTFTATTSVIPDASDGATLGSASKEWSDLYLADGAQILFGDDQEVRITHVADKGLTLSHEATGAATPFILTLESEEDAIAADDVIAGIEFKAGDSDNSDAILPGAGIFAVADAAYDASNNRTNLVFTTGTSETAGATSGSLDAVTNDMELGPTGILTLAGNIVPAGIVLDGNTITGVDDSGEFTNDDAHIMTSAAVEDKILGYSYITASSSDTLSNKTIAISQVTELSNLTADEGAQLENIGTTTISATQWGYLGAASGAITNTDTVDMGDGFVLEDGDGTEVTITENKEVKFVEGGNIDINWSDTSTGSDGDPFDLTFTVPDGDASTKGAVELATAAEVITGTDAARVVTADTLSAKSVVCDIDVSSLTDANIVTITHNLGTADIVVQVYDKTTEANIMCDIARTTDDFSTASTSVVSIDFGTAPPNDCRALITSLAGATAGSIAYT